MIVNTNQNMRGFTLIETMVATGILLIAVVGPMSLLGNSLNNIYFVRDQMLAVNLAQEGIEVIRQRRDTNFLDGSAWDSGFGTGDCAGGLTCVIDTNPTLAIIKCTGLCTEKVYKDPVDGFYHQYPASPPSGVSPSLFSRKVTMTKVNNNEYLITINVTWSTGKTKGSVAVSETIFRWAKA